MENSNDIDEQVTILPARHKNKSNSGFKIIYRKME